MRSPHITSRTEAQQPSQQIDLRLLWTWMGSPTAVGFPLIIFLLIYPVAIGWSQEPTPELALEMNYHLFDLLSGVGAALSILLVRFVVKLRVQGNLRTTIIVVGWFISGLVGALLQYEVASSVGFISPLYAALVPLGGFSFWSLSFCFTILISLLKQNRQTAKDLTQAKTRLQFLQETVGHQVAQAQEQFQRDVEEKISPVLESLAAEVENLSSATGEDSKAATTLQLRAAALDVVRPLSHQLYSAETDLEIGASPSSESASSRVAFWEFFTRGMNVNVVFNAPFPAILILAFFTSSYYIGAGWAGVFGGCIATTGVVVAAFTLLHRLTRGRQLNAVVVVVLGVIVALLLSTLYVVIPQALSLGIQEDFLVFIGVGVTLVLVGTVFVTALYDNRLFAVNRTKEANDENAALVARSRQEVWIRQKQIAKIVHGSIQSRLNAARIRLTQAKIITPELVETVLADLESARAELSALPTPVTTDIKSQLSELANFWHGVCTVTYSLDNQAQISLDDDSTATQALLEVVSEGVSNSVKHSQAEQVQLTITQVLATSVNLELVQEIRNPETKSFSSGLGTQILDQLTLNWSFKITNGTARLQAEIPVTRSAQ